MERFPYTRALADEVRAVKERCLQDWPAMLDTAISEFEALIAATSGREQTENVLSLLDALFDLSEAGGEGDADAAGGDAAGEDPADPQN